jgi:hypothetical protein
MAARIAAVGHRDGADRMVDLVLAARDSRRRSSGAGSVDR